MFSTSLLPPSSLLPRSSLLAPSSLLQSRCPLDLCYPSVYAPATSFMFILLKSLARSAILPPSGPLILAIVVLLYPRRRPRLSVALLVIGLGSLWLLATPLVSDALQRLAQRYPPLDLSQ